MKGVTLPLLTSVTTGTGTAVVFPITVDHIRFSVIGGGTISGGNIIIEEADTPDYSGTWSLIVSTTAITLTGGNQDVIHIFGTIGAARARISSNITGGGDITVNVTSN